MVLILTIFALNCLIKRLRFYWENLEFWGACRCRRLASTGSLNWVLPDFEMRGRVQLPQLSHMVLSQFHEVSDGWAVTFCAKTHGYSTLANFAVLNLSTSWSLLKKPWWALGATQRPDLGSVLIQYRRVPPPAIPIQIITAIVWPRSPRQIVTRGFYVDLFIEYWGAFWVGLGENWGLKGKSEEYHRKSQGIFITISSFYTKNKKIKLNITPDFLHLQSTIERVIFASFLP